MSAIPEHEQRITALVLEALEAKSPAMQALYFRDLAQLTRSDELCVQLLQMAERADALVNETRQLRLNLDLPPPPPPAPPSVN